jgi:cobalt-zinc-cadmium efflux system protein
VDLFEDLKLSESEKVLKKLEELLHDEYGINHVTLQMEYNLCNNKNMIHNEIVKPH